MLSLFFNKILPSLAISTLSFLPSATASARVLKSAKNFLAAPSALTSEVGRVPAKPMQPTMPNKATERPKPSFFERFDFILFSFYFWGMRPLYVFQSIRNKLKMCSSCHKCCSSCHKWSFSKIIGLLAQDGTVSNCRERLQDLANKCSFSAGNRY